MQFSAPKPISFALAIVIVAIGCAVAYRVLLGTSFSYKGQLGDITLGTGESQTTLNQFVEDSNKALSVAEESITRLEEENGLLKEKVKEYRQALEEAKQLAMSGASGQSGRDQITQELSAISVREPVTSLVQEQNLRASRELISKQLKTTSAVKEQITAARPQ